MSVDFALPQMGFDMTEAKIAHWMKAEGQKVEAGEVLAEIATEKVTLELDEHPGGVIEKILVPEGQTVPVGTPIVRFAGGDSPGTAKPQAEASPAPPPAAPAPPPPQAAPVAPQTEAPPSPQPAAPSPAPQEPAQAAGGGNGNGRRVKASPLARRLAGEKGVDLSGVQGSGPLGRILRDDVIQAASRKAPWPGAETGAAPSPGAPTPMTSAGPAPVTGPQELSPIRKVIGARMTESKQQIPHFYLTTEVRMDSVFNLRADLTRAAGEGVNITVNDFVIKATALALASHPQLNAWFVDGKIRIHERINIALAVALEDGLVVPALLDCQTRSLGQIAAAARDLVKRARKGVMKPEEFTGGTFTISNLGMFGVDDFQAIINPPQIAILSVGVAKKAPVVDGDKLAIGTLMKVGISVDHRATDGAAAARFLAEVKRVLENPMLMLL